MVPQIAGAVHDSRALELVLDHHHNRYYYQHQQTSSPSIMTNPAMTASTSSIEEVEEEDFVDVEGPVPLRPRQPSAAASCPSSPLSASGGHVVFGSQLIDQNSRTPYSDATKVTENNNNNVLRSNSSPSSSPADPFHIFLVTWIMGVRVAACGFVCCSPNEMQRLCVSVCVCVNTNRKMCPTQLAVRFQFSLIAK